MLHFTEEQLKAVADGFVQKALQQGLDYGFVFTAMAFLDALQQAEFVEWRALKSRVIENLLDYLEDTPRSTQGRSQA